jgi:hypothetical protein
MKGAHEFIRCVMLVIVALSNLTAGKAAAWDAQTGNLLFENCAAWPRGQRDEMTLFKTGTCVGYIWGVAGVLEGSSFCLKGVQPNQLVDVIKRWLDDHPEVRHYAASSLIETALKEKFPCR